MIFDKIDIRPILRGQAATLRDNAFSNKASREDRILFGLIPLILALGTVAYGFRFRLDAVNGFLNMFSILTGLLLNLLVLVLTLTSSKTPENVDVRKRTQLIKEIFSNICYAVVVAVIVVCVALVSLSYMRSMSGAVTGPIATFLLCLLTVNFVFTLLMVLTRMYVLIDKDLRSDSGHSRAA